MRDCFLIEHEIPETKIHALKMRLVVAVVAVGSVGVVAVVVVDRDGVVIVLFGGSQKLF